MGNGRWVMCGDSAAHFKSIRAGTQAGFVLRYVRCCCQITLPPPIPQLGFVDKKVSETQRYHFRRDFVAHFFRRFLVDRDCEADRLTRSAVEIITQTP
jgi:hypothetical protein